MVKVVGKSKISLHLAIAKPHIQSCPDTTSISLTSSKYVITKSAKISYLIGSQTFKLLTLSLLNTIKSTPVVGCFVLKTSNVILAPL